MRLKILSALHEPIVLVDAMEHGHDQQRRRGFALIGGHMVLLKGGSGI